MKKLGLGILTLIASAGLILVGLVFAQNPLEGKIIALDAGHGGAENGAINQTYGVAEKNVNLAVVYALKQKLEDPIIGAKVVLTRECDETISSRKSRVDLAIEKCKTQYGRKCDVLVSVHHNGSTDPTYDGTMVIYNEKQDIPLATALHDALIATLGLLDKGLDHGGYGMTVFGHLVSALTEAYYITNATEAGYYLSGTSTLTCTNPDGTTHEVLIGDRVDQEAEALYQGLNKYFSIPSGKPPRR